MDNYKTGHINLPLQPVGADLRRSDTRSFGESHATELSSIDSHDAGSDVRHPGILTTPPVVEYKPPSQPPAPFKPSETHIADKSPSAPINVADLNQSPATIPPTSPLQSASVLATGSPSLDSAPSNMPTVAETGIPVSAGSEGPGPATGSLLGLREPSHQSEAPVQSEQPPPGPAPFESAEDEKKRLEREERERILTSGPGEAKKDTNESLPAPAPLESAEDEKKRLEREERERILKSGTSGQGDAKKDTDEDLPPQYQEI